MTDPHTTIGDFYEEIEPTPNENQAYRDAAMIFLPLLEAGMAHCLAAKTPEIGRIQIKYALGLESRSMRDTASRMGITVACISRGAREFIEANNLPVPNCMKKSESTESYRDARRRQINQQTRN